MWKFARSWTVAVVSIGYHAQTLLFAAQMTNPSNSLLCRRSQNGRTKRCHSIEKTARRVQRGAKTVLKVESSKFKVGSCPPGLSPPHFPLSTLNFKLSTLNFKLSPSRAGGSQRRVNSCPCAARALTTSRTYVEIPLFPPSYGMHDTSSLTAISSRTSSAASPQ